MNEKSGVIPEVELAKIKHEANIDSLHLREHADSVAGDRPSDMIYELVTLVTHNDVADLLERLAKWKDMSADDFRLHCGEMGSNEIRSVRAVLNAVVANVGD